MSVGEKLKSTVTPTVSGVLLVDVAAAVDELGILNCREAAKLMPPTVPAAAPVRLNIGHATIVQGGFGLPWSVLRTAGRIEVEGQNAAGIKAVLSLLAAWMRKVEVTR